MVNILIGCTGSVAAIKLSMLVKNLLELPQELVGVVNIQVIVTEKARYFINLNDLPAQVKVYSDENEWNEWKKRGDPILHIDLGKWADVFVIAPLDANTLAKIANGICDNLLTCTARAWQLEKPLIFCPAMNTKMYDHPLTAKQLNELQSWGYHMVPVIGKTLMCGDTGLGAMAEVSTIIQKIKQLIIV